jgi:serine protease Do
MEDDIVPPSPAPVAPARPPTAVIIHLSGAHRGATVRLRGERLRVGTGRDAELRVSELDFAAPADGHCATLEQRGASYEIVPQPDCPVWVNGERIERLVLASGDVVEIGAGGPVLRFRLYAAGAEPAKSVSEVFADWHATARYGRSGTLKTAGRLVTAVPLELATRTTRRFRGSVAAVLVLLGGAVGLLAYRNYTLERRLAQIAGPAAAIARDALDAREIDTLLTELHTTSTRLEALESRSRAGSKVIAAATRSTAFLQSAYRFVEQASGRPLRRAVGPDGSPLSDPDGDPVLTLDGDGPVVEALVTGTAFVAGPGGLLLTNRHVAVPWESDEAAQAILQRGFDAVLERFRGYLPGESDGFDLSLVALDDSSDLAVLRGTGSAAEGAPLTLHSDPPAAGDEVIVLGYPLGMRALMARADVAFVRQLLADSTLNFWTAALKLAQGGHISPLASQGIVGQVTAAAIVFDAETTHGGSGGPVLNLAGEVVAIAAAIQPEYGGANMGVPAARAAALLARLAARSVNEPPSQPAARDSAPR